MDREDARERASGASGNPSDSGDADVHPSSAATAARMAEEPALVRASGERDDVKLIDAAQVCEDLARA